MKASNCDETATLAPGVETNHPPYFQSYVTLGWTCLDEGLSKCPGKWYCFQQQKLLLGVFNVKKKGGGEGEGVKYNVHFTLSGCVFQYYEKFIFIFISFFFVLSKLLTQSSFKICYTTRTYGPNKKVDNCISRNR